MAQSVERLTSAQVMISWSRSSGPRVRLCADSLEPEAYFGFCVSLSLSLSLPLAHSHSLTLSRSLSVLKANKHYKEEEEKSQARSITLFGDCKQERNLTTFWVDS